MKAIEEQKANLSKWLLAREFASNAIDKLQRQIADLEREQALAVPESERVRVLVADPPWPFDDRLPGAGRGAGKHYNLSALDRIAATPLPPMRDDAVCFFWRVAAGHEDLDRSLSEAAPRILRAWGFVPKTEIVWFKRGACSKCKGEGQIRRRRYVEQKTIPLSDAAEMVYDGTMETTCEACDGAGEKDGFGMGRIVRGAHEVCLIGVRGRVGDLVLSKSVRSAFETLETSEIVAPVGRHSAKPEIFYRLVETLFPGPYHELFARRSRPGWTCSGHQVDVDPNEREPKPPPPMPDKACPKCGVMNPGDGAWCLGCRVELY